MSQSSEFCRHNSLCCFSTCVYCCKRIFRYRLSPETFGYTLLCRNILRSQRTSNLVSITTEIKSLGDNRKSKKEPQIPDGRLGDTAYVLVTSDATPTVLTSAFICLNCSFTVGFTEAVWPSTCGWPPHCLHSMSVKVTGNAYNNCTADHNSQRETHSSSKQPCLRFTNLIYSKR
jgi:hypothetical protein